MRKGWSSSGSTVRFNRFRLRFFQTMEEETQHVRRTDEGASISVDITRGTGTRDQEKWSLKGKGETAEQALLELKMQLREVVGDLDDRPIAEQAREFQPEQEDSDE